MNTPVLTIILLVCGLLIGWLVPNLTGGRRPYGMAGDLVISAGLAIVFGLLEWMWALPALNITGVWAVIFALSDPLCGSLVGLWIMRKIKPAEPLRR